MGKIILCLAQFVRGCTLYASRVCLATVLFMSIPTILARPTTLVEFAVFYLMTISYFFLAWIWPAKSLLHALNEKLSPVERTKNNKGLTWIGSALIHSFILLALLVNLNTEPGFLLLTGLVLFSLQLVVWLAYIDACSSTESHSQAPNETNEDVQPQQVIDIGSENLERICTRNQEALLRRTEVRTGSQEERQTVQSLTVDIPDGAAHQDLPPSYDEVVTSQRIMEKDCAADDHDEDDVDGVGDHDDTETNQPPRYSQLNLHLA